MSTQPCNHTNCECIGCKAYRKEKGIPEPDPNVLYNAKVREVADKLAMIEYIERNPNCQVPYQDVSGRTRNLAADNKMPQARAMVAKMAKEYEEGFFASLDYSLGLVNEEHPSYVYYNELCIEELRERGLIPNTKTEENA